MLPPRQRAALVLHDVCDRPLAEVASTLGTNANAASALLAEDVWGVVDGGATVRVATRPSVGRRAVSRRWANAERRLAGIPIAATVRRLNGESAVVITAGGVPFASVHVETRGGLVAALRVVRAPERLGALEAA